MGLAYCTVRQIVIPVNSGSVAVTIEHHAAAHDFEQNASKGKML